MVNSQTNPNTDSVYPNRKLKTFYFPAAIFLINLRKHVYLHVEIRVELAEIYI